MLRALAGIAVGVAGTLAAAAAVHGQAPVPSPSVQSPVSPLVASHSRLADSLIRITRGSPLCGITRAPQLDGRPRHAIVDLPYLRERYVALEGSGAFLTGRPVH